MIRSEGKLPTFTTGSTKWLRIVAIGNYFLRQFARERGVDWSRYYKKAKSLGNVTATDTFAIPSTVYKMSPKQGDYVRVTHTDNNFTDYTLIPHDALKRYNTGNYVAKIGSNLVFNKAFTATDAQFGGALTAPCYDMPETFSADADEIDMDNPNWLVCAVAGDRVKNDVTRKDLKADLINEANEIMASLKEENMSQLEEVNQPWNPLEAVTEEW